MWVPAGAQTVIQCDIRGVRSRTGLYWKCFITAPRTGPLQQCSPPGSSPEPVSSPAVSAQPKRSSLAQCHASSPQGSTAYMAARFSPHPAKHAAVRLLEVSNIGHRPDIVALHQIDMS